MFPKKFINLQVAFSGALCYTDKVFVPETEVGNGVKADERSAF